MISIQQTLSELEKSHEMQRLALECYVTALRTVAQYPVELEEALTGPFRHYMEALSVEVTDGSIAQVAESRSTFRGLVRDYRDRATHYLANLREQIASTAQSLEEIVEGLGQSDTDHGQQLKESLTRLRDSANTPEGAPLRPLINSVASTIEQSLEQMRRQHQLSISQFQTELRMLHKRIDSLEAAAAIDEASKFSNHRFMAEYLSTPLQPGAALLTLRIKGLAQARSRHGAAIAEDLITTFGRRLRNAVPRDTVVGRWGESDFLAIVCPPPNAAPIPAKKVGEHLSTPYACMMQGKVLRVSLEVTAEYLAGVAGATPEQLLEKVTAAFE